MIPQMNVTVVSLVCWFIVNISTLILNKYIYQMLLFNYPLTLTAVHMLTNAIGAYVIVRVAGLVPLQPMSWTDQFYKVFPLSFLFCSNIVLGNISLRWVPVSFMQTVKSSVPAFTILIQVIFFKKSFSTDTYFSLFPIVGGVVLASYAEVNYNNTGFYSALVASIITALLAIMSGVLLTQQLNAVNLLYYMAPVSFLLLLPLCYMFEWESIHMDWEYYGEPYPLVILLVSGIIALMLNVSTFLVIKNTSPLTYTVSGNLKVVLSITISVLIFGNEITILNGIGCAVAVVGVMWYNHLRYLANQKPAEPILPAVQRHET